LKLKAPGQGWTPETAFLHVAKRPYPFFLDGGSDAEKLGRRSFVGCDPFAVVHGKGREIEVKYPRSGKVERCEANPFDFMRDLVKRYSGDESGRGEPPFPLANGGAVGYLAYDLFMQVERIERTAVDDLEMPDLFFALYDSVLCFDNMTGIAEVALAPVTQHGPAPDGLGCYWDGDAADVLDVESTEAPAPAKPGLELKPNQSPDEYMAAVTRAREYIAAGDVYQVNYTQRFEVEFDASPVDFYMKLRETSPAPFGACVFPDGYAVLSNSPERYLLIDGDYIETRPIKGTRPRGATPEEDAALVRELAESKKDMAEHLMIVDLERNDLGRVCTYNSVHVPEFMVIESYANVHHMVSTVAGRVHPARDALDCIRNSFPGGSITGAPKVRAIEIIDELEPTARGVYCGSIGYIDFDGRVDLNIAIRTAIVRGQKLYFQVGGGIVTDSCPQEEYDETITKAQSIIKTLTGEGRVWRK